VTDSKQVFKTILVAYAGSPQAERATDIVFSLAEATQSKVLVFAVIRPPEPAARVENAILEDAREHNERSFAQLRERTHGAGVEFETQIEVGHPAEHIVHRAEHTQGTFNRDGKTRYLRVSMLDARIDFLVSTSLCTLPRHGCAKVLRYRIGWFVWVTGPFLDRLRDCQPSGTKFPYGTFVINITACIIRVASIEKEKEGRYVVSGKSSKSFYLFKRGFDTPRSLDLFKHS
jgi:hypothetical protein